MALTWSTPNRRMCLITTRYIGLVIHISFSVTITVLLLSVFLSIKEVNHEQVNGKKEAFFSLHQFYCNLFYFETEDRKNVFYGEVVRASRSKIVVQDTDSGEKYIFLRQDTKGEQP